MLGDFTLLGDPIVRAFTMAHDIENQSIGFIAKTGSSVTTTQVSGGTTLILSYLSALFIGLFLAF
jgi:hypothetical protein